MANTILAFDELDTLLGPFFLDCKKDLDTFFDSENIITDQIHSKILNDLTIKLTTDKYTHFVFGAYSHGDINNLLKSAQTPFVSIALNGSSFENSFFYTFSCDSGKNLGKELIDQKCLCFIGYEKTIAIWTTYLVPFVECANYGLVQFFKGHDTYSVKDKMYEKYTEKIDEVYKTDFLIASILKDNRDALVIHGGLINIKDLVS